MTRLFGTDGVRGVANTELTCELAFKIGQAAVRFLGPLIAVGKDTRLSGDMLEAALSAGIMSAGGTELACGIIPTPAVAILVRELHADGGVVISASHNPPEYNGIKLFDAQGFKLSDEVEDAISSVVLANDACAGETLADTSTTSGNESFSGQSIPGGLGVGIIVPVDNAREIYIEHAVESVRACGISFDGMRIALDTGHGASSFTTPEALRRLGADVVVINDNFSGTDINVNCGSTHLEPLRALMEESGADVGIAHDGDADRVILMAPGGVEIDGDIIEAVCALDMKERGCLPHNTVVTTVMCNLGFVHAMREAGISVVQTKVGDRYVLEEMRSGGYALGGEQSGHVILLEHNSTGDGLMTACQFLSALVRLGKTPAQSLEVMERFPQTLVNVQVSDKQSVLEDLRVKTAVQDAEAALGDAGRVLLRPSGTEPLVRVMVEAYDAGAAERHAQNIADVVRAV